MFKVSGDVNQLLSHGRRVRRFRTGEGACDPTTECLQQNDIHSDRLTSKFHRGEKKTPKYWHGILLLARGGNLPAMTAISSNGGDAFPLVPALLTLCHWNVMSHRSHSMKRDSSALPNLKPEI